MDFSIFLVLNGLFLGSAWLALYAWVKAPRQPPGRLPVLWMLCVLGLKALFFTFIIVTALELINDFHFDWQTPFLTAFFIAMLIYLLAGVLGMAAFIIILPLYIFPLAAQPVDVVMATIKDALAANGINAVERQPGERPGFKKRLSFTIENKRIKIDFIDYTFGKGITSAGFLTLAQCILFFKTVYPLIQPALQALPMNTQLFQKSTKQLLWYGIGMVLLAVIFFLFAVLL